MKKFLLVMILFLSQSTVFASSGADPYTPTKQQWVALWLNSSVASTFTHEDISVSVMADPKDKNAILVLGAYWPEKIEKPLVEYALKHFCEKFKTVYSGPNWEWIKYKVELIPLVSKPKDSK